MVVGAQDVVRMLDVVRPSNAFLFQHGVNTTSILPVACSFSLWNARTVSLALVGVPSLTLPVVLERRPASFYITPI